MMASGEAGESTLPSGAIKAPMNLLALPESTTPPFRWYKDFLRATLNPNKFKSISISRKYAETAHQKWLTYQCIRKPSAFSGKIELRGDKIITIGGIRGGGKTSLLFNLASHWKKIFGVYGSLDDEILALLRMSKYVPDMDRALILGPEETSVNSSWDYKYYRRLHFSDIESHDIIVMPQKIHTSPTSFFLGCEYVSEFLLRRPFVDENWFLVVTEAANILYSRQSLKRQKIDQAKAWMIYLLRQLRHVGLTIALDSQYLLALDKEVRGISDYTFLKNLGAFSLPREIEWIYGWTPPYALRALYPNEFVATDKFGGVFTGMFRQPPWCKTPNENIYESLGIRYDFGDASLREFEIPDSKTGKGGGEDIGLHSEILNHAKEQVAKEGRWSIKGLARLTGHDRETIRQHLAIHERKECSCFAGERMSHGVSE